MRYSREDVRGTVSTRLRRFRQPRGLKRAITEETKRRARVQANAQLLKAWCENA